MRKVLASAFVAWSVVWCASGVQADEYDPALVSADAQCVAHVDFDQMRSSTVGQLFRAKWLNSDIARQQLQMIRNMLGFDPIHDLHSVTVYGPRLGQTNGVMVVNAELDRDKFLSFLQTKPGFSTTRQNGRKLYSWLEREGRRHEHRMYLGFAGDQRAVTGHSSDEVEQALDVIAGKAPSLKSKDNLLTADVPDGAIMIVRAINLSEADVPKLFPLLRHSKTFAMHCGEERDTMFVRAEFETDSEDIARQIQDVAEGFRAMLQLRFGDDENARDLLDKLQVKRSDNKITVSWKVSLEKLQRQLDKQQTQTFVSR